MVLNSVTSDFVGPDASRPSLALAVLHVERVRVYLPGGDLRCTIRMAVGHLTPGSSKAQARPISLHCCLVVVVSYELLSL